jgi:hypothetical protein
MGFDSSSAMTAFTPVQQHMLHNHLNERQLNYLMNVVGFNFIERLTPTGARRWKIFNNLSRTQALLASALAFTRLLGFFWNVAIALAQHR